MSHSAPPARQVLEGEGKLSRAAYKDACASVNTWMRTPLGCIAGYTLMAGLYAQWESASRHEAIVLGIMGPHCVWNALFFGRQARRRRADSRHLAHCPHDPPHPRDPTRATLAQAPHPPTPRLTLSSSGRAGPAERGGPGGQAGSRAEESCSTKENRRVEET